MLLEIHKSQQEVGRKQGLQAGEGGIEEDIGQEWGQAAGRGSEIDLGTLLKKKDAWWLMAGARHTWPQPEPQIDNYDSPFLGEPATSGSACQHVENQHLSKGLDPLLHSLLQPYLHFFPHEVGKDAGDSSGEEFGAKQQARALVWILACCRGSSCSVEDLAQQCIGVSVMSKGLGTAVVFAAGDIGGWCLAGSPHHAWGKFGGGQLGGGDWHQGH